MRQTPFRHAHRYRPDQRQGFMVVSASHRGMDADGLRAGRPGDAADRPDALTTPPVSTFGDAALIFGDVRIPQQTAPPHNLTSRKVIRIGARRSALAQHHAHRVADALRTAEPGLEIEVVAIATPADSYRGPLHTIGGKGVFVAAIDQALQDGLIDVAAHCLKDVPGDIPAPDGLAWGAYLDRDDPSDCLVLRPGLTAMRFDDLPDGARLGTSAVRRKAQLLRMRPDLTLTDLRGNIAPRLDKLDASDLHGIVLARSALVRAGFEHRISHIFDPGQIYPAVGAGLLGARCRANDHDITELLSQIDAADARLHSTAERAFLMMLQGNCQSPVAGHCRFEADGLSMSGMVFGPDGRTCLSASLSGSVDDPEGLGRAVADAVLAQGADQLITATRSNQ